MRDRLAALVREMVDKGIDLKKAVGEFEQLYIREALERSDGNITRAADSLGVHRNTLRSKMTSKRKRRKPRSRRPPRRRGRKGD